MKKDLSKFILIIIAALMFSAAALSQSTEFTYQGHLLDGSAPATGTYDIQFVLFDAVTGGTEVGPRLTHMDVVVTDGVFVAKLDFGLSVSADYFLEIRVRRSGEEVFTRLLPRQVLIGSAGAKSVSDENAGNGAEQGKPLQLGGVAAGNYILNNDPRLYDARGPLPGSPHYIQNGTAQQADAHFNINGTGKATGSNATAVLTAVNAEPGADADRTNLPPAALLAEASSSVKANTGVIGIANGEDGIGLFGITRGAGTNRDLEALGTIGVATSTTGYTVGVGGSIASPKGVAVAANAQDTAGTSSFLFEGVSDSYPPTENLRFYALSNGDVYAAGSLVVKGTKSSATKLPDGRSVLLYAVEAPESLFEDMGTAKLKRGRAIVTIDSTFAQTSNTEIAYQVFLTPGGNCRGLYVTNKTSHSFEVREIGRGRSNIQFDFRIVARRRGYENDRFAPAPPAAK